MIGHFSLEPKYLFIVFGASTEEQDMSETEQKPRCRMCGNQMYMTRFQSEVTGQGVDREYAYECLWCEETEKVRFHVPHPQTQELAA